MALSRSGDESGYTLVELLVVMVVFGVLSAVVASTLVNAMGSSRRTQERTYRSADVQKTLELMSKDVRVALPVTSAAGNDLSVEVYRDGACHVRRWYLDAASKTVVEVTRDYPASTSCLNATGTPAAAVTRTLLRNVANTAATPLFSYYRLDAAGVRQPITALPASATDTAALRGVVINVHVNGPESGRPIKMETSVELRNG